MVYGCHVANCLHCGKQWIVGDCIPSICDECSAAGRKDTPFFGIEGCADECPVCKQERTDRLAAARKASEEAKVRDAERKAAEEDRHRQRPWPGRKSKGGGMRGW